jgi:hypothetical protein
MAVLTAADATAGEPPAFGAGGAGLGVDVLRELERVRGDLAALAQVVEEIRAKVNAHTHGGAVAAPAAGEQAATPFVMH